MSALSSRPTRLSAEELLDACGSEGRTCPRPTDVGSAWVAVCPGNQTRNPSSASCLAGVLRLREGPEQAVKAAPNTAPSKGPVHATCWPPCLPRAPGLSGRRSRGANVDRSDVEPERLWLKSQPELSGRWGSRRNPRSCRLRGPGLLRCSAKCCPGSPGAVLGKLTVIKVSNTLFGRKP